MVPALTGGFDHEDASTFFSGHAQRMETNEDSVLFLLRVLFRLSTAATSFCRYLFPNER